METNGTPACGASVGTTIVFVPCDILLVGKKLLLVRDCNIFARTKSPIASRKAATSSSPTGILAKRHPRKPDGDGSRFRTRRITSAVIDGYEMTGCAYSFNRFSEWVNASGA